jgi:phosphatidylserine/phosphatidylglycerophosphate/cardiolipin synthase-like enzyme
MPMDGLLIATGFTGAFTLLFIFRKLYRLFTTAPSTMAHYSPHGGCTEVIVRELATARREILVQAYSFTSREITQALIDAKMRGVHVQIILDHSNEKEPHTELPFLIEQGLAPLIDAEHAIAHNKIMVIDGHKILTGSFNFTNQAEKENAENLLVINGQPELAQRYQANFHAHKAHSRQPQAQQVRTLQPQARPETAHRAA